MDEPIIDLQSDHYLMGGSVAARAWSVAPLALPKSKTYAGTVVNPPVINVEERIDRFVGKRTKTPDALSLNGSRKADAIAWRKAFGGLRIPRGVHRFKTHQEADQWLWRMIARPTS
jgi:hypothetical protein